jgi:hypothetical protein
MAKTGHLLKHSDRRTFENELDFLDVTSFITFMQKNGWQLPESHRSWQRSLAE